MTVYWIRKGRRFPVWLTILVSSLIICGLLVGLVLGVRMHRECEAADFRQQMVSIVHSRECRKVMEEDFRELDPHALTDKGVIQTYEIVDSSIEHNPMGGIDYYVIINHDEKQTVSFNMDRYDYGGGYGPLESGGSAISGDLSARLYARYGKQIDDYDWASKYKKAHPNEFPPENNTQKKDE